MLGRATGVVMPEGLLPLTDPGAVFAVLLLAVLLGPLAAERVRLPSIVGLVAVGMVLGPNVLGVLGANAFIETLGYVGLLYLMFQGGLDLDLDGFARQRRDAVVFGAVTFLVPMLLASGVAYALGFSGAAAVILASAFASHTLLSYPTVARLDLRRNRAVTASLGATLLANVAALLVLAVAAATVRGGSDLASWLGFGTGLAIYVAVVLGVVPRVTRWFFTGLGQDRQVRLTYLLSGMGVAAVAAGLIGIEPIVGAFLVGLAFNRFVPTGTVIAGRVQLLGDSVFVPAFLISTGMVLDPVQVVTDPRTIGLAVVFTATAIGGKWVAAEVSGRLLGVTASERGLMFSLSVGQAAGTLAAVTVAQELFLIDRAVVNAVVVVILVSALVAGSTADRHAPRVDPGSGGQLTLGSRVVVPVANPSTVGSLVRVAGQIAGADAGAVVAVNVLPLDAEPARLREHRQLAAAAERVALAAGSEVATSVRIDASPSGGVLHTVVEQAGSCLVMGWKGYANAREGLFGSIIDETVSRCPVPVLVCRPGDDDRTRRVVLVVTRAAHAGGGVAGTTLALEVARRVARQADARVVLVTDLRDADLRAHLEPAGVDLGRLEVRHLEAAVGQLGTVIEPGDVVVTGLPAETSRLGRGARRLARAAPGRTVIVAVPSGSGPHGG